MICVAKSAPPQERLPRDDYRLTLEKALEKALKKGLPHCISILRQSLSLFPVEWDGRGVSNPWNPLTSQALPGPVSLRL